jgi:hypothetical protein
VRKSVNTKLRMIKVSIKSINHQSIIICLSEEEYKCAQVRKHKAAQDKKDNNNNNKRCASACKCVQVRKNKAAHIEIFIRRGVQVCASP